jgi:hypothetical protein
VSDLEGRDKIPPERLKERAKRGLRRYFEKKRSPRFMLSLVIMLTGIAGFGISFVLLKAGVTGMWLRYPISVLGAYGVFLGLIRLWVEIEKRHINPEDPDIKAALEADDEPAPLSGRRDDTSWLDWLDLSSGLDAEGCLPTLLIGAVIGLVVLLISIIGAAPVLIAEVFIDVALAGLLYRRLRIAANEHWLGTAIRRTWAYVVGAALLLSLVGLCLDQMAPGSDTAGKAVREILSPKSQP